MVTITLKLKIAYFAVFSLAVAPCVPALSIETIIAITEGAIKLINLGTDIALKATDKTEEKIDELQKSMDALSSRIKNLESEVETLIQMVEETPYKILISQHIEKIRSCVGDLRNYLNKTYNEAAIENLRMCYWKREDVRALGDYLNGVAIAGSVPLMELYSQQEGFCNGTTISAMFQYLHTYYVDGCIVIVAAEKLKFGNTSNLVSTECKTQLEEISKYMDTLYRQCSRSSCETFNVNAKLALAAYESVTSFNVKTALKLLYPWYNFLVIQMKDGHHSRLYGNYSPPYAYIQTDGKWYDIYYVDIFRPIYNSSVLEVGTDNFFFGVEENLDYVIDYDKEDMPLYRTPYFPGMKCQSLIGFVRTNATFCAVQPAYDIISNESRDASTVPWLTLTISIIYLKVF